MFSQNVNKICIKMYNIRASAQLCARAHQYSKSIESQLSLEKKIINFKWFLMILDYFENSWKYHEFLKTSNVIFMHILLTFWLNMSFLETSSKHFECTIRQASTDSGLIRQQSGLTTVSRKWSRLTAVKGDRCQPWPRSGFQYWKLDSCQ